MLKFSTWHGRISKAWRKKVKRKKHKPDPPKEVTTRIEDGYRVTLLLWDNRHTWFIVLRIGDKVDRWAQVRVDRPLSQAELFRWLAKTTPIE